MVAVADCAGVAGGAFKGAFRTTSADLVAGRLRKGRATSAQRCPSHTLGGCNWPQRRHGGRIAARPGAHKEVHMDKKPAGKASLPAAARGEPKAFSPGAERGGV
jgi:hypothetical protein